MNYEEYIVKQGDCISSIAFERGFFPETIWNDPKNESLKQERKNLNALLPGDVVFIREKEEKKETVAYQKRHRFKRKGVPEKLVIRFMKDDKPRAAEKYELDIDGKKTEGETDDDGYIKAVISPDANLAIITFMKTGEEYSLQLGHLDPVTVISGVQGRLDNLGFYSGPVDGNLNEALTKAIKEFQEKYLSKEQATGELNELTQEKLRQTYGG